MDEIERRKDAEILTASVSKIYKEIEAIEKREILPLKIKIEKLKDAFLDKYLVDSSGMPVRVGMTIEKDKRRYKVLDRYQQKLFGYLGNARVVAIREGQKRGFSIYCNELIKYTIID